MNSFRRCQPEQVYLVTETILLQNKEIEELTKICDELIAKMGKS